MSDEDKRMLGMGIESAPNELASSHSEQLRLELGFAQARAEAKPDSWLHARDPWVREMMRESCEGYGE
jgi:hypothetical protein